MPPEQIDRAVGALLALALDLAVADQAIEPRAGLTSIKGADQLNNPAKSPFPCRSGLFDKVTGPLLQTSVQTAVDRRRFDKESLSHAFRSATALWN
jgi:hypothetical protein